MATRLGRYDVIRTLARGALTDLLLGRASGMEGFQRHVVIKRLRHEHAQDPAVLEMFVNEARLAAALHHHNIVQVLDIGEGGGEPFFAMEYVHGVDLRRLLGLLASRSEQLPFPHVVSIIAAAAAALHHAHEQRNPDGSPLGIVHRQVTPGNILVGYDGNVKIVDFGIAKAAIKRSETGVGVLRGSAPYMAPEQCAGQRVDRRSDVFALGIVLYELSTVRRLFKGANEFLTMSAVVNAEVPRPSQYRRDVPSDLEVVMLKALARDPLARYQTAGAMAEALDKVARAVGVGASTTQLANYMKLQFGDQKEPWLTDGTEQDPEITAVDFDGEASGLAPPPTEAVKNFAIPRSIEATKSSPINQARTSVVPPPRAKGKTLPPPDRSFNVPTAVDSPMRAKTEVDAAPVGSDVGDASPPDGLSLPKQKTNVAAPPPPPAGIEPTRPSKNDLTQVVEPLSVIAARAQTVQPAKSRTMLWLTLGGVAIAGVVAAIALWPGSELAPASPAPATTTVAQATPEEPPAAPQRSAMEMTARDYEAAHASADAAVAEPVAALPQDAAVAVTDDTIAIDDKPVEAAPPPVVTKPSKPAVRPATKPTKRTTKLTVKRTATKPAATKKATTKKTKPKWNPDDLFIGE